MLNWSSFNLPRRLRQRLVPEEAPATILGDCAFLSAIPGSSVPLLAAYLDLGIGGPIALILTLSWLQFYKKRQVAVWWAGCFAALGADVDRYLRDLADDN